MDTEAETQESLTKRINESVAESIARADKMLADTNAWIGQAPVTLIQDNGIRELLDSVRAREANIRTIREELLGALEPYDLKTKQQALQDAMLQLENKLRPIDTVGTTAIDFDVPKYLGGKGYRAQSREMLSAVEVTAAGHVPTNIVRPTVFNSAAMPEHLRYAEEGLAGLLQEERRLGEVGHVMTNPVAGMAKVFGTGIGQRRALCTDGRSRVASLGDHIEASEHDWFTEAMGSLEWNEQEKKFSCPMLFIDFDAAWKRIYQHESQFEDAKAAAKRHRLEATTNSAVHTDRYKIEGRAMLGSLMNMAARMQAVIDDESENEQKRRAAVMIAATECNIELTALAFSELSQKSPETRWAEIPFGGNSDLAHGFGPNLLFTDDSTDRLLAQIEEAKDRRGSYVHAVWRMALEGCAFPNVADTFTAMGFASSAAQKQMLNPPDGSPSNAEVRLMQVAYWAKMVTAAADGESRELVDNGRLLDHYVWLMRTGQVLGSPMIYDAVARVAPVAEGSTFSAAPSEYEHRRCEFRGILRQWSCGWREQGYARLDVSHKLAAALMLTDMVESVQVHAPWKCFSVHVPPGITRVSRILCMGDEYKIQPIAVIFEDGSFGEFNENHLTDTEVELLRNFVRGACMAVEQGHAQRAGNHGTSGAKGASKRSKPGGPGAGERYQLAAPVKIDLRDVVREHLSGKHKGGSPKVQFIVRGHPRNQACGPKMTLRKLIWVEPYWKGDPEAIALLRGYEVEGDKLKG